MKCSRCSAEMSDIYSPQPAVPVYCAFCLIELNRGLPDPEFGANANPRPVIATLDYSGGSAVELALDHEHPMSHYGIGVLIRGENPDDPTEAGQLLDGATFRSLRDRFGDGTGAEIMCKPGTRARVCAALGVPEDEPGIVETKEQPHDTN